MRRILGTSCLIGGFAALILSLFTTLILPLAAQPAHPNEDLAVVTPVLDCSKLPQLNLSSTSGVAMRVVSATVIKEGPAPYCDVKGYISPQIEFEVRLPTATWTQRFVQTGCGGLCGVTRISVPNAGECMPVQNGEVALATTNTGHSSGTDAVWAADDPQLRVDFAYRAVHATTLAAKTLIQAFYGQKQRYAYFIGCSEGGREAAMEAQRYPEDFNGIVAGAPALNWISQNTFYHAWNARHNQDAQGLPIISIAQLPILHAAAIAQCDALDGLKDGLIDDPRTCHFDPVVAQCKPGQNPSTCLSAAQVEAARAIYQGPRDENGQPLVIGGPEPGSELGWRGVFVPNAGEPVSTSAASIISIGVVKYMAFAKNPPEKFTLADFHFDQTTFQAISQMQPLYDAADPDLGKFAAAGGKIILWHGWADASIPPRNTLAYFTAIRKRMDSNRIRQFARLYMLPGAAHCNAGDSIDFLTPMMNWVEKNVAPARLYIRSAHREAAVRRRTSHLWFEPVPCIHIRRWRAIRVLAISMTRRISPQTRRKRNSPRSSTGSAQRR